MRRDWTMTLLIGGSAASVALILLFTGLLQSASGWLSSQLLSEEMHSETLASKRRWLEVAFTLIGAFGFAWLLIETTQPWQKRIIAIGGITVTLLLAPSMASLSQPLSPLAPLIAVALSITGSLLYGRTKEGQWRAHLENSLGDRISAASFAHLLRHPDDIKFTPEEKEITSLACRLLLPTEPTPSGPAIAPESVTRIMSLFSQMAPPFLLSHGAYLEKDGPDVIRASFGMLENPDNNAGQACTAALALLARLRSFARDCHTRWGITPRIAIGIHSGKATVGLVGARAHTRLVSLGETAVLADRLALANARYGTEVIISPETYRRVETQVEVRPIELIYDPLHQRLTEIYQPLALSRDFSEADRARRDAFWQGVIHYRAGSYREAMDSFRHAMIAGIDDPPLTFLTTQLQEKLAPVSSRSLHLIQPLSDKGGIRLEEHL